MQVLFRSAAVIGCLAGLSALAACAQSTPTALPTGRQVLATGMELQRLKIGDRPSDPTITALYFDPAEFDLTLLTAQRDGRPRTVRRWCKDHELVAGINASMYLPNLRSTGWMVDDDVANNGALNSAFGGVLAFKPRRPDIASVRFFSPACDESVQTRVPRDYRCIVQNYRLLDCDGAAISWKDPKSYSVAGVGQDRRGWIVLLHSGDPCRTNDFGRWIADPVWGLVAAHFVEGGPDATLCASWDRQELEIWGRYPGTNTGSARVVPNVLGIVRHAED